MKIQLSIDPNMDRIYKSLLLLSRRDYNRAIKYSLTEYLDEIRLGSLDFINDDTTGLPNFRDREYGYTKRLQQATSPTRLTSRSGRLVAGIKEGNGIMRNIDQKVSSTDPNSHKSLNGKIIGGGTGVKSSIVNYESSWSPYIRAGSAMLKDWQYMKGWAYVSDRKRDTAGLTYDMAKKLAHFRFYHETGIRGGARPFFEPAHQQRQNHLVQILDRNIRRMYAKNQLL